MSDPLTAFPADEHGLLDGAYKRVPYHDVGQFLEDGWTIARLTDRHFHPMDWHGIMMKMPCKGLVLDLPLPPSVNAFERDKRGRPLGNRSASVQHWIQLADGFVAAGRLNGKTVSGPYILNVWWPKACFGRWDSDNRIKILSDYLQRIGVIENDKLCWDLRARWRGNVEKDWCRVEIKPGEI